MSVSKRPLGATLLRLFPTLNYERARREIVLALEDGQWRTALDVFRAVRHNPRGEFATGASRVGPGTFTRILGKLEDEGIVETREENVGLTDYESRRMCRLTEYGSDELDQMGAANL